MTKEFSDYVREAAANSSVKAGGLRMKDDGSVDLSVHDVEAAAQVMSILARASAFFYADSEDD